MGMSEVIPSATRQHCNTAVLDHAPKFGRLWQQIHHFQHRIAKNDPRRPTSPGLKINGATPAAKPPASNAITDNSTVFAAPSSSAWISPGKDCQRLRQKSVWLCQLFENGVMMAVGHLDRLPRKTMRAPRRPEFA